MVKQLTGHLKVRVRWRLLCLLFSLHWMDLKETVGQWQKYAPFWVPFYFIINQWSLCAIHLRKWFQVKYICFWKLQQLVSGFLACKRKIQRCRQEFRLWRKWHLHMTEKRNESRTQTEMIRGLSAYSNNWIKSLSSIFVACVKLGFYVTTNTRGHH